MDNSPWPKKPFDLEERTFQFAKEVMLICKRLQKDIINLKIIGQVVASFGSVGANYLEANEALSLKDFSYKMKIARKECKETTYWLKLLK